MEPTDKTHLVLARKYRPQDFSTLYGQEALVRTLSNALSSGRLAQAYMLTGVRGVGKTTTARIIARALNCIGVDDQGNTTPEPCGTCSNCTAIAADRHPDVLEMDAASRTGVGDVRELIESVRYAPVQARSKVYIIDEVHMLSKQAFNALLKTLEEPPPHVKFIFATTEIRQVPVTILSRCQRFDLRRISTEQLQNLFTDILSKEQVEAESEAVQMIARAADGSARDGLSLLDQAIALSDGQVLAQTVGDMLGLADRGRLIDLFQALLSGNAVEALSIFDQLYEVGSDPLLVIKDLATLSHLMTRAKVAPKATENQNLPELERSLIEQVLPSLSLGVLGRLWQALQQGIETVERAQDTKQAGDMVLMRLAYMANVPTPGEMVKQFEQGGGNTGNGSTSSGSTGGGLGNGNPSAGNAPQASSASAAASANPAIAKPLEAPPKEPHEKTNVIKAEDQVPPASLHEPSSDGPVVPQPEAPLEADLSSIEKMAAFLVGKK
ncbi:MAG: DNA polymerase III subunit gamma/tau, partial [Alphaproteobacteria bacterium]